MRETNLKNKHLNTSASCENQNAAITDFATDFSIEQAEMLLRSIDDLVFLLDAERNFLKCFQPESANLLMPPVLFIGKNLSSIPLSAETMSIIQTAFDAAEKTGITQTVEYSLLINENLKWFNAKISVIKEEDNNNGFIVLTRDVTELHKNTEYLVANEEKYHLLADNTTDLVVLYNPDGTILYISPSVYRLLGFEAASLTGIDPSPFVHPDDLGYIQKHFRPEFFAGDTVFSFEYRLMHANGNWIYFSTNRKFLRNEEGVVTHILACCRDITEKVKFDEAIKKSEAHYKLLADNILDLVGLHDLKGVFEYVSPSSLNVLGYTPEDLVGKNAFDLIHPREASLLFEENKRKSLAGIDTFIDEFRIKHKNGHYVFFETTTKIIRDTNDKAVKFLSTSRDITEWKQAQFALQESEEKYRSLVESSENLIIMVDVNNQYLFANSAAAKFIGMSQDKIIGRKLGELSKSSNAPYFINNIQQCIYEEKIIRSENILKIDNVDYCIRTSFHPIRNAEGKVYAVLINAIDITNLKKTESLLEEQNKGLREIAYLQSHILRAPLSNIKHLISLLDQKSLSEENKIIFNLLQISADNMDDAVKRIVEKTYLDKK